MKNYVNLIAMMALATFADDLKAHPTYGWRICNYAGEGDYNPNRRDIYTDGYAGYSFADAVIIAAQNKSRQPDNDIWVEPDSTYAHSKEKDLCVWILENNCAKGDYTTLENMAADRQNLPNGGVSDHTYDREYRQWVENGVKNEEQKEELIMKKEWEEYEKEVHKQEDVWNNFVESRKSIMKEAWNRFDAAMRDGRDEDIDEDYFFAQEELREFGINYDCCSPRLYIEDINHNAAISQKELKTFDWVYAHGELRDLAGYDIVNHRKAKPIDKKHDRIEHVYAVVSDGREIPSTLYFWLDSECHCHGLLVADWDKKANEYAKNAYEKKACHI